MSVKHDYRLHYDGLSTFLNLAASVLSERQQRGELPPTDAKALQGQIHASMHCFGAVAEALALERLEYSQDADHASANALLLTGRLLREMAEISETLTTAMTTAPKAKALQAA